MRDTPRDVHQQAALGDDGELDVDGSAGDGEQAARVADTDGGQQTHTGERQRHARLLDDEAPRFALTP